MKRMKLIWFLFKLLPLLFVVISLAFWIFFNPKFHLKRSFVNFQHCVVYNYLLLYDYYTKLPWDCRCGHIYFMCSFLIFTTSDNTPFFLLFLLFDTNLQWLIIICRTLYITIWFIETPTQSSVIWRSYFMRWWTLCNNEKV